MRRIIFILPFVAFAMISCNKEVNDFQTDVDDIGVPLVINGISADLELQTKASSTNYSISKGLGIFVEDEEGNVYYDQESCINNKLAGAASNSIAPNSGTIYLYKKNAVLYSYYPYNENITDITKIPIEITRNDNFFYGTPVSGINSTNNYAEINLNIPYSELVFELYQDYSYSLSGLVSRIAIQGENICASGILNAKTGNFSSVEGLNEVIEYDFEPFLIKDSTWETHKYIKFICNGESKITNIYFTIDDQDYVLQTDETAYEPGKSYKLYITLKGSTLGMGRIKINSVHWNSINSESYDLK